MESVTDKLRRLKVSSNQCKKKSLNTMEKLYLKELPRVVIAKMPELIANAESVPKVLKASSCPDLASCGTKPMLHLTSVIFDDNTIDTLKHITTPLLKKSYL
jgi:hypothetical protein